MRREKRYDRKGERVREGLMVMEVGRDKMGV